MGDTEYITKESALACFNDWIDHYGYEHTADEMVEYQKIEYLPEEDVRPVVRGGWVHGREVGREYLGDCLVGIFYDRWTCSKCGYIIDDHTYSRINYNFCPNCGADMRGE